MGTPIRTEMLAGSSLGAAKLIMQGEIAGLVCFLHTLPENGTYTFKVSDKVNRVFFFVAGCGTVTCAGTCHPIDELAVLAPGHLNAAVITARGPLAFLELVLDLSAEDLEWIASREVKTPYFAAYSACRTYREAIKSPKTVSRTLLPENLIPRFCAGSVQTTGPDLVAAHKHPMLEQLFVGLPGNDCQVRADEAFCPFTGNMLLHIPLGSEHSVRVEADKALHYIWIDRFHSAADVDWITQHHFENKP